ncbi:MAG: glycosyltransferase family 4 protein [Bacteroidia bacterium]|nr:glycosyltransferase family 4 protein [Bacteroidia bacterium]
MKLLVIGFVWPEPNSSAAGIRMMQLLQAFQSQDYNIVFASSSSYSEHAEDLKEYGIETRRIKLNDSSFNDFVRQLNPDIVLFDRFMTEEQFGWRVAEECPNAMRILDTEDLHSLRKVRQELHKSKEEFTIDKWLEADITKREIASIYRSDFTLVISEYEIQLLIDGIGIDESLLLYLPFMYNTLTKAEIGGLPEFENRQHFVTIGNFRHEPNYDSIVYLRKSIWPLIKEQLPNARIYVYGSYPMQKIKHLHSDEDGFFIKGWAKDADQVMRSAKVCLTPLRFGAGLKGKMAVAMRNGTPVVTTRIGAEGLSNDFGGFIEDIPDSFVKKAIELYLNRSVWNEKQNLGFEMMNSRFEKSRFEKKLVEKVNFISGQLVEWRLNNFIGTMLQFHTLQSNKYLSKWIESKQVK